MENQKVVEGNLDERLLDIQQEGAPYNYQHPVRQWLEKGTYRMTPYITRSDITRYLSMGSFEICCIQNKFSQHHQLKEYLMPFV